MTSSNFRLIDNLKFTRSSAAGYEYTYMPFSLEAIQLAFPNTMAKLDERDIHLYLDGEDKPIFTISKDGDAWDEEKGDYFPTNYVHEVVIKDARIEVFDGLRVGNSKLKDFSDPFLTQCDFHRTQPLIWCGTDCNGGFGASLYFRMPDDYRGDMKSATKEELGLAVLDEVLFYISGREDHPKSVIDEAEATLMMREMLKSQGAPKASPKAPAEIALSPIKALIKQQFSAKDALKSYLALVDIAIHNGDSEELKGKIREICNSYQDPGPEDFLSEIVDLFSETREKHFIIVNDWKADARDFHEGLEALLIDVGGNSLLPEVEQLESDKPLGIVDVLELYSETLLKNGYDLIYLDLARDEHSFFITPKKNRRKVIGLLAKAMIQTDLVNR